MLDKNSPPAAKQGGPRTPLGQLPRLRADGTLPGAPVLYAMRDGQGPHYLMGGLVATLIARPEDTAQAYSATILSGGMDAELPLHTHAETDEAIYILDGRVELWLDDRLHLMTAGDYAFVPAGTLHGHRMKSHRARILTWAIGAKLGGMWEALGTVFPRPVHPETPCAPLGEAQMDAASNAADVSFRGPVPAQTPVLVEATEIPEGYSPYVLRAGEGEHLVAADQLFTFLQTRATSQERFITVMTEGPTGPAIPWHYHEHHAENFFCVDGQMTMWVNGEEIHLNPGDYMQVPAGTVHSYRLDTPYTRFLGWLVPPVFEPFFRYVGDPTEMTTFPVEPPPFRFDRVLAHLDELDLQVLTVRNPASA
ncbi:quercetin 2,3-dioxygenase [Thioclava sp. GXIMD2076]|uniref:quercetin 2,3-dioxygenase n=1 Tax=Thioclava sp. GXIMD2076 TaxID=3131931 RepID=UPI0030D58010